MSLRLSIALTTALLTTATVITTFPARRTRQWSPYVMTVGDSYVSG